ncbi:helix-turn-helix domain-containing protein [Reinekea forsetii]|nr:helix-turn-helix domain-containing protein [Reinekea forsetii]
MNTDVEQTSQPSQSFAERLQILIGDLSVSAFARKVKLSESLIRKYLRGSEPSLAKANQIAVSANVSLEWLATGCGYQYRQAEVVDRKALTMAQKIVFEVASYLEPDEHWVLIISAYQHLRSHKKPDGYLDEFTTRQFVEHLLPAKG